MSTSISLKTSSLDEKYGLLILGLFPIDNNSISKRKVASN
jgi:hypothetical protein